MASRTSSYKISLNLWFLLLLTNFHQSYAGLLDNVLKDSNRKPLVVVVHANQDQHQSDLSFLQQLARKISESAHDANVHHHEDSRLNRHRASYQSENHDNWLDLNNRDDSHHNRDSKHYKFRGSSQHSSDNRLSDNRFSDNRLSDNRHSDNRLSDNRLSDNRFSDNRLSDNRHSDDRANHYHSNNRYGHHSHNSNYNRGILDYNNRPSQDLNRINNNQHYHSHNDNYNSYLYNQHSKNADHDYNHQHREHSYINRIRNKNYDSDPLNRLLQNRNNNDRDNDRGHSSKIAEDYYNDLTDNRLHQNRNRNLLRNNCNGDDKGCEYEDPCQESASCGSNENPSTRGVPLEDDPCPPAGCQGWPSNGKSKNRGNRW